MENKKFILTDGLVRYESCLAVGSRAAWYWWWYWDWDWYVGTVRGAGVKVGGEASWWEGKCVWFMSSRCLFFHFLLLPRLSIFLFSRLTLLLALHVLASDGVLNEE